MSTHPAATAQIASQSRNPLEVARSHLIRRLLELQVPKALPTFPSPSNFEGLAGHIREAANLFDEWLAAVGAEVRDNATTSISSGLFCGSFTAAVDGNEAYTCEEQGIALREYAAERRNARRAS